MIEKLASRSPLVGQSQMLAEMARLRAQISSGVAPPPFDGLSLVSQSTPSFSSTLEQAIKHVDTLQQVASEKQRAVDMGISDDLTGAMLESQKASVAFSAMVQVRNKLSTAFDEVMNISM